MPFSLMNAAQIFQHFIDEVLHGLPFYLTYIEDLLIASPDKASHRQHLQVFTRFQEYDVQINMDKSELRVASLSFLGHTISPAGITPLHSRAVPEACHPVPTQGIPGHG